MPWFSRPLGSGKAGGGGAGSGIRAPPVSRPTPAATIAARAAPPVTRPAVTSKLN